MKKILFLIPFYYKWANYANLKSNYEFLIKHGYSVDLFSIKEFHGDYSKYDLLLLMGSGTKITKEEFDSYNGKVISCGFSDPNLFNEDHFLNCDVYCTNDLTLSKSLTEKPVYFYNTACDKRHHKLLDIKKETDILVYGVGTHPVVTNRNEVVNNLRKDGFSVKVFGRGWDAHKDTHPFLEGEGLANEIGKAHILLDVTNEKTAWGHRVFESGARGTPVLTIDREDTRSMFEPDKEIILYKDYEDMKEKLTFYLKSKEILREIGLEAHARCYKDHDISVRIKELIKIMEEL